MRRKSNGLNVSLSLRRRNNYDNNRFEGLLSRRKEFILRFYLSMLLGLNYIQNIQNISRRDSGKKSSSD